MTDAQPGAAASTWSQLRAAPASALAIALLVAAYLAQALVWGRHVAPFDAPDEPEHTEIVAFIAQRGRFPVQGRDVHVHLMDDATRTMVPVPPADPATGFSPWTPEPGRTYTRRYHYASVPGANYVLAAAVCRVAAYLGRDAGLIEARAGSAFAGALAVLGLGLIALRLRPDRFELHVLLPATLAFLPQFVFLGAYVNGDAYAVAAAVLVFWRLLVGAQRNWPWRDVFWFAVALALAFHGKATSWLPAGIAALAALFTVRRGAAGLAARAAATIALFALFASPWVVFSVREYGAPVTFRANSDEMESLLASLPAYVRYQSGIEHTMGPASAKGETYVGMLTGRWARWAATSVVGRFGWMDRPLATGEYGTAFGVWIAAIAFSTGLAVQRLRRRAPPRDVGFLAAAVAAVPAAVASSLWFSMHLDDQPQGRHSMGAWTGFALVVAFGLTGMLRRPALRVAAAAAYVAVFATLCLFAHDVAAGR